MRQKAKRQMMNYQMQKPNNSCKTLRSVGVLGAANDPPEHECNQHLEPDPFGHGTRSRSPKNPTARGRAHAEVPVPKAMPGLLGTAHVRHQTMHVRDLIASTMAAQVKAANDEVFFEHTQQDMRFYCMTVWVKFHEAQTSWRLPL